MEIMSKWTRKLDRRMIWPHMLEMMNAMTQSKADIPKTGVPLSGDGVVILKLTNRAQSPDIVAALSECKAAEHVKAARQEHVPLQSKMFNSPINCRSVCTKSFART